jgi:Cu(I)/Ag(I) efflux system protein CusF
MKFALSALMTSIAMSTPVWAQQKTDEHSSHHAASSPTAPADGMTDAEVRKVDLDAAKITLKHGEIKNLEMPPMTMVFRVADASVVGDMKPGDKVRFRAEQVNGAYHVKQIEKAP